MCTWIWFVRCDLATLNGSSRRNDEISKNNWYSMRRPGRLDLNDTSSTQSGMNPIGRGRGIFGKAVHQTPPSWLRMAETIDRKVEAGQQRSFSASSAEHVGSGPPDSLRFARMNISDTTTSTIAGDWCSWRKRTNILKYSTVRCRICYLNYLWFTLILKLW